MKPLTILIAALAMVGCESIPDNPYYGPLEKDGGYSSLRRSIETWAVRYTGDPKMTGSTVRDLALLRSAEIAENSGYRWFTITETVNESGHVTMSTSFQGPQTAQVSSSWSGGVDKLTGSQSVDAKFISQYRYEIECSQEEPSLGDFYNAADTAAHLREKYNLAEPVAGAALGMETEP